MDMNNTSNTPNCTYCQEPLTDSELDSESGTYYSSHHGCVSQTMSGRYEVRSYFDGETQHPDVCPRYTHLLRALECATDLAQHNRCRWVFRVWDRTDEVYMDTLRGSLRETAPSGTPFYGEVWTPRDDIDAWTLADA